MQASLPLPIWVHLPHGFCSTRPTKTCLRLKKSQCGLTVAPRLWYQKLIAALLDMGYTQSKQDPFLLYKNNSLLVAYVDDLGVAAPSSEIIDKFISDLKARGFKLTHEGSFTEYLGIKFAKNKSAGTIELTHKGLIKKIINATGLANCNPNRHPAMAAALGIDSDGEPYTETWNYPSIVGMLLHLSTNTQPYISFAVSQVA
jgi:hypothetical protein